VVATTVRAWCTAILIGHARFRARDTAGLSAFLVSALARLPSIGAEIDVIWDRYKEKLGSLCGKLNAAVKKNWQEWEIPREPDKAWPGRRFIAIPHGPSTNRRRVASL
jgi:hypothetical protein